MKKILLFADKHLVGKNIPTSKEEVVSVRVDEYDGSTGVCICADQKDA